MRENWTHEYERGFGDGVRMEKDHPTYSHRNGEYEQPKEVEGFYFRKDTWFPERNLQVVYHNGIYTFKLADRVGTGIVPLEPQDRFVYFGPIAEPAFP